MINQTFQQSKPNPTGKALLSLISLIFGIIILILIIMEKGILPYIGLQARMPSYLIGAMINIIPFMLPLFAIPGIISGVIGLKSTKRKFAIAGIVLCLIGLVVPLYYFLSD